MEGESISLTRLDGVNFTGHGGVELGFLAPMTLFRVRCAGSVSANMLARTP